MSTCAPLGEDGNVMLGRGNCGGKFVVLWMTRPGCTDDPCKHFPLQIVREKIARIRVMARKRQDRRGSTGKLLGKIRARRHFREDIRQ